MKRLLSASFLPAANADLGLLLMRAMLAVVFLYHGSQKLFGVFGGYGLDGTAQWMGSIGIPLPLLSATLAALAEFGGGLALLTGVAFRWLMVPLAFTMLVAAFVGHGDKGFDAGGGGMEYPLTLALVVAGLFWTGPGRYVMVPGTEAAKEATA